MSQSGHRALTPRSSGLRCVSAAEHQTAEQYYKTGRTKPRKHLPRCDLLWKTRQDFLKIPSLCEAALETERRCFSKVIIESNVTPKITRSPDYFSIIPPIVNGGDWGCIVRDLETIIVLVLITFNFIPQRSHHSLTLPRSRIRYPWLLPLYEQFAMHLFNWNSFTNLPIQCFRHFL